MALKVSTCGRRPVEFQPLLYRCSNAEQKVPVTVGVFKKETKSAEEQKKEILEVICIFILNYFVSHGIQE